MLYIMKTLHRGKRRFFWPLLGFSFQEFADKFDKGPGVATSLQAWERQIT
jgi:hypothetical protein